MATYLFELMSHAGKKLEAIVSLQGTLVYISFLGKWDNKALACILWGALRRMTEFGGNLRIGGYYRWDDETQRVTCWVKSKPVGWAWIDADKDYMEGQIECLMHYALNETTTSYEEDYWRLERDWLLDGSGYEFEAINALMNADACDTGALLPQFLTSPALRLWEKMFKVDAVKEWLERSGVGSILAHHDTRYQYIQAEQLQEEADSELPDWLRPVPQVEAAPDGTEPVFDDLDF